MGSRIVTSAELEQITGKIRPAAQRRALDRMKISYFVRPDGRPVVRADALIEEAIPPERTEPNWEAIESAASGAGK